MTAPAAEPAAEPAADDRPANVTTHQQPPRLATFAGKDAKGSDTSFELWLYEVKCLMRDKVYPTKLLLHAVRKSLRGEAGEVAMRVGTDATLKQILDKLEGIYGVVEPGENILSEFYSAHQEKDETVSSWGCRLERLLDRAQLQGLVARKDMDRMLRTKFWTGLRWELKMNTRHKYDSIKKFDQLRIEIRKIEHEYQVTSVQEKGPNTNPKPAQAKMMTTDSSDGSSAEFKELRGMIHKLTNQFDSFQNKAKVQSGQHPQPQDTLGRVESTSMGQALPQPGPMQGWAQQPQTQGGHQPQYPGVYQAQCQGGYEPQHQGGYQPQYQGEYQPQYQAGYQHQYQRGYQLPFQGGYQPQGGYQFCQQATGMEENSAPQDQSGQRPARDPGPKMCWRCDSPGHFKRDCPQGPLCYRCRQRGHIARDCHVRSDHSRQMLNGTQPLSRGGQ